MSEENTTVETETDSTQEIAMAAGMVTAATAPDVLIEDEDRVRFSGHVVERLSAPEGTEGNDWSSATLEDLLFCLRDIAGDVGAFASIALQRTGEVEAEAAVEIEQVVWDAIRAAGVMFVRIEDALTDLVVSPEATEEGE